jgi:hypothetical protein
LQRWLANEINNSRSETTIDIPAFLNKNALLQSFKNLITLGTTRPGSAILQIILVGTILYGFASLISVRTDESIASPWEVVPAGFFVSYILGISVLFYAILTNKLTLTKSIPFLFFFYLIPALAFTIILENPFTGVNVMYSEGNRQLSNYGRFVSDPSQEEALSSPIGKSMLQVGGHFLDTIFAKYLQVNPFVVSLYSVPIVFSLLIVISLYAIGTMLRPSDKVLPTLTMLAFFSSQHNIFIFTPPGKPETLALGFLVACIFLSFKFLKSKNIRSIVPVTIIAFCALLIHQYVGMISLFALAVVLTLKYFPSTRPPYHILRLIVIGFIAITPFTIVLPLLDQASKIANVTAERFTVAGSFDLEKTTNVLFPAFNPANSTNIFDAFINNFHYIFYGMVIFGFLVGIYTRIDKEFLMLFGVLIAICMQMVILVENFILTDVSYRFFYYATFVAVPVVAIGFYVLIKRFGRLESASNLSDQADVLKESG